jgi:hypothetical protein
MENEKTEGITNQAVSISEKKHDMAWVISQIILREIIVGVPIMVLFVIIAGVIIVTTGMNIEAILQRAQAEPEFAKQLSMLNQLISAALFPLSYIGTRWGCKYVVKNTYIEEKDYGKIGYWVGLIPIGLGLITGSVMVGALFFGIFLTPKLVKKWLAKFSSEKIHKK